LSVICLPVSFKTSLISKDPVILTYYIWHLNCFLRKGGMTLLDENLFIKLVNDIEASDVLTEGDKDLLRKLARKATEMESEAEDYS